MIENKQPSYFVI